MSRQTGRQFKNRRLAQIEGFAPASFRPSELQVSELAISDVDQALSSSRGAKSRAIGATTLARTRLAELDDAGEFEGLDMRNLLRGLFYSTLGAVGNRATFLIQKEELGEYHPKVSESMRCYLSAKVSLQTITGHLVNLLGEQEHKKITPFLDENTSNAWNLIGSSPAFLEDAHRGARYSWLKGLLRELVIKESIEGARYATPDEELHPKLPADVVAIIAVGPDETRKVPIQVKPPLPNQEGRLIIDQDMRPMHAFVDVNGSITLPVQDRESLVGAVWAQAFAA
ncbi:MAG TPA: hypothetical protein VFB03_01585 [Candidatus Saccharimonadales bacterium]|nr:hypothetical protein [Candidatus Saccharimonadales bacterium]